MNGPAGVRHSGGGGRAGLKRSSKTIVLGLFLLWAGVARADIAPDLDQLAGQTVVRFEHYQIQVAARTEARHLFPWPESSRLNLWVEARLRITGSETDRFYFRLTSYANLRIEELRVDGQKVQYRRQADFFWVELPVSRKRGEVLTLLARYNFSFKPAGKQVPVELNGTWYPRGLLPEPVTAELELLAPPGYIGVGNGNLIGVRSYPMQLLGYVWRINQPQTSLGASIGRYQISTRSIKDRLYRVFAVSDFDNQSRQNLLEQVADLGDFFQGKFGGTAYSDLTLVVSDTGLEDACTGTVLFLHPKRDRNRQITLYRLSHEISHYWWGNLIYPKELRDWWTVEGFACFSSVLALERFGPDPKTAAIKNAGAALRHWRAEYQSCRDNYRQLGIAEMSLAEIGPYDIQRDLFYSKGGYVLHMARLILGEAKFSAYLQEFVKRYAGRSAGIRDFTGLGVELYGSQLMDFYRQWVFSSGEYNIALRNVKVRPDQGKYFVSFEIVNTGQLFLPNSVDLEIITGNEVHTEVLPFKQVSVTIQKTLTARPKRIAINAQSNILEPRISDNVWNNRI
jgi:hypothetical protein